MDALKPVSRVKLADEIQGQIRQAIVNGEFTLGSPLSEPQLARQFGVSRAPIREAFIALEREGLVEFVNGGRTRVVTLDEDDFEEICSLRSVYERLAGTLAARHWNDQLAEQLHDNVTAQRTSTTWAQLSQLDMDFHETLMRGAGHARLLAAWHVMRSQCEVCLVHFFGLEKELGLEPRDVTAAAHQTLIDTLSAGDPQRAGQAMAEHAESWLTWLKN